MAKTKTSKKPKAFSADKAFSKGVKPGVVVIPHDPSVKLRDIDFIAAALIEALFDGDMEAFKEILHAHLDARKVVGRILPKQTYYDALKPGTNPSAKTLFKMVGSLFEASVKKRA